MASLDDIWDTPAEVSARSSSPPPRSVEQDAANGLSPGPRTRPKSSRPLFLDSGSEDESAAPVESRYASKTASNKPDIDAFFADLDDDPELAFQELAPSLDVNALKRQVDAKLPPLTPHQIMPSSSPPRDLGGEKAGSKAKAGEKQDKDTGAKKRPKRPKLDESRLLGPDGFPALIKQSKSFKPKGKGHEFWAHKMYPNNHFIDTVQRVEKLCHSKRMHIALGVWRDEAKGLINGHKIPGSDESLDSDSDRETAKNSRLKALGREAEMPRATQDLPVASEDDRSSPAGSMHGASLPPSSPAASGSSLEALDDDFDIDAMIQEEESARAREASAPAKSSGPAPPGTYGAERKNAASAAGDEDEDMWDAFMDDVPDEPYVPPAQKEAVNARVGGEGVQDDIDEDLWDMMNEMDEQPPNAPPAKRPSPAPSSGPATVAAGEGTHSESGDVAGVEPAPKATNDEGWDEMYA
ncbi:hypothetical protein BN946_scf184785.g19 [Trametes cinnabarina]|uniref:Chromosome segregation in meiosis protein n=1 Tax=Pycnoporus cinnabarinus TaxID=5643 RepID=A0A060SB52_PYCCI|nr:hypothetical protein BN946_scf184785.g19 [Trametes cinnabarina]